MTPTIGILQRFEAWADANRLRLRDTSLHIEVGLGLAHIVVELESGEKRVYKPADRRAHTAPFQQV